MWNLPGPGTESVSPASAGGFLATAPPGKSQGGVLEGEMNSHSPLSGRPGHCGPRSSLSGPTHWMPGVTVTSMTITGVPWLIQSSPTVTFSFFLHVIWGHPDGGEKEWQCRISRCNLHISLINYLFIWLYLVLVAACRIFLQGSQTLLWWAGLVAPRHVGF